MVLRIITLFISAGFWIIYWFWQQMWRILGNQSPGTCVVLYYHGITKKQRSRFARQLDDILRFAEIVSADTQKYLEDGVHYVAVTFDDAFVSIIENALPELAHRNIPFTIFVPTRYIGRKPEWLINATCRNIDDVVMSIDQLKELNMNNLASIGSHCATHTNLLSLNEDEAKNEIFDSKRVLDAILQEDVRTLSFPHGYFSNEHVKWSRRAGYERVFSILPTLAFSNQGEYLTGRVLVLPTDWRIEFRLKLLGAYRWAPLAISLKRKISAYFRNEGNNSTH
jgi:peptidoglycan/xylan/chitin deacetylase (PgdA/CDA1 family)